MSHPHPHPHPHPQPGQPGGPQPQAMQVNAPDPAVVAAIDAQFRTVDIKLGGEDDNTLVACGPHGSEVCSICGTDFFLLNQTSRVLKSFPKEMPIPPPPNVIHPARSPMVTKAKEEGNVR